MVIIDSPRGAAHDLLQEKAERILSLLAGEEDLPAAGLARILREHTPLSFILERPAERIVALIREFQHFLASREEAVAVRLLPMRQEGHYLLLTSTPDAPYLLDSVQNVLFREEVRFQMVSHPIMTVRRRQGRLIAIDDIEGNGARESFIILELEGVQEEQKGAILTGAQEALLAALKVERDSRGLAARLHELEQASGMEPFREFWQWLQKGNFLPFSYRCLEIRNGREWLVREAQGSALGLAPDPPALTCCQEYRLSEFDPDFNERMVRSRAVVVEEIGRLSPIHRAEPLSYLGFREETGPGTWREHGFLGLFSRKSVDELTGNVPPLRRRVEAALTALGVPRSSHDYRKMMEIFNTFPKVELFFIEPAELVEIVRSFTLLYRHGAVKAVSVGSLAVRGVTLLVIMPREFYTEEMLPRFERYLRRLFRTPAVAVRIIHISPEFLSLHVGIQAAPRELRIDLERLERELTRRARSWEEKLRLLLSRTCGEPEGSRLWRRYAGAFSREYRARIHPRFALRDVRGIERVLASGEEVLDLWGPFGRQEPFYRLQFYSRRQSYLNDLVPLLENLGLLVIEEVDFQVPADEMLVYVKSFAVRPSLPGKEPLSARRGLLLEALAALRRGEAENDDLNRLLLPTGLSWQEIDVFRGYRNYYLQLGSADSKRRIALALVGNPRAATLLFRYFETRFRPQAAWTSLGQREEEGLSPLRVELAAAFDAVTDLNEDRILRALFNLIDSTVRTNFFVRRNRPDYFFSFKISAIGIIDMPAPRPMFEVYVHAAGMEGIHLRGGKVARGGIRWSDRPDDFRTEILGLMKTQMTKNALIVPVGAKGGFVVKRIAASREEGAVLAREAYQVLIRGLLDLTDNRRGGEVVRPSGIIAYDEDDPYLVVAADKGTAHLSDTANALSREYGFWLGDAFASGGSRGYDHKALGITARGAWECIRRHFREIGTDTQEEPFTVMGIGDMSGDVFGNGMLLSRRIRLLGAFDHRHIFLDPDPDPEISFAERQRLAALPRSSWDDYDRRLLSPGGGIFPRGAKDIPLSAPVRQWLGVRQDSIDGPGLVRLLLTARVDLLWNGGIGTYVKAAAEKHEEVGDRANDALRVDAGEVRAQVVGEGGNLGFTQRGRIEYALAGGRLNTDAVDNSGGVDCSDHEVNLKILLRQLIEEGRIASEEERDRLLLEVRDEVCAAVVGDNDAQSLCLSLDRIRCSRAVESFLELSDRLSGSGLLDRRGEAVPAAREVLGRTERSFTRPELAILMAYAKMQLYQALLESDLPDREESRPYLRGYFPTLLRERFGDRLGAHPLAREIAATRLTNIVIDQAGSSFPSGLGQRTGASLPTIAAAYLTFDQAIEGAQLRQAVRRLDQRLGAGRQYEILLDLEAALAALCRWALEHALEAMPRAEVIEALRRQEVAYRSALGGILPEEDVRRWRESTTRLEGEGFDAETASRLAGLPFLPDFLPVAALAAETGGDLPILARTCHEVREALGLDAVLRRLQEVPARDQWDRMARQVLEKRFQSFQFELARAVWGEGEGRVEAFLVRRRARLKSVRGLTEALQRGTPGNYHPFTVLADAFDNLIR